MGPLEAEIRRILQSSKSMNIEMGQNWETSMRHEIEGLQQVVERLAAAIDTLDRPPNPPS
jgi:hypothetical protein